MLKSVFTNRATTTMGHSSQAINANGFIFIGGQIGLDVAGDILPDSVEEQAENIMNNIKQIIKHAFSSPSNVLHINIYLLDLNDFDIINKKLAIYLGDNKPAITTLCVAGLPKNAKVQVDMIVSNV